MLARQLGYRSRRAMYEDMDADELTEHEIAYAVEPWGEYRQELLHGVLCSLIDACHRTKGQVDPPMQYMPIVKSLEKPQQKQSAEEMQQIFKAAVGAWGGTWNDGKKGN